MRPEHPETIERLAAENRSLHAHIAELEARLTTLLGDQGPIADDAASSCGTTAQHRGEADWRASAQLLQQFVEHAPAAIAMFDTDMRYLVASRRWSADYSLGDRPLVGQSHYAVFPELSDELRESHRRCLAGAVERGDDAMFTRANGAVDWVTWEAHPWYTAAGTIGGIIIFSEVITARKQAEEQYRTLSQKLGTILDLLPIGISISDAEHTVRYVNPAAGRLLDLSPAQFATGDHLRLTYLQADGTPMQGAAFPGEYAVRHRQVVQDVETGIVTASGRTVWASVSAVPVHFSDWGVVVIANDITERVRAERELRDQAQVLDQAQVMVRDMSGRILLWTHGTEQLYGYSKAEALGQISHELLRTIFPEPLDQILATLQQTGHWEGVVTRHTRAGQAVVVASQWLLDRGAAGHPARIIEAASDITVQERATTRLQVLANASRALAAAGVDFRAILDQITAYAVELLGGGSLIRLLSEDGEWLNALTIHDQNSAVEAEARAYFGRERVHISSASPATTVLRSGQALLISQFNPPAMGVAMSPEDQQAYGWFEPHSAVIVPLRIHGRVSGTLSFLRHDRAQPAFTADDLRLAEDLADRAALAIGNAQLFQQAQREIAAREQAEQALVAEHARSTQLKDEFLANMSHELRTPLNAILGRAEALQEQIYGPLTEKQRAAIGGIEDGGRHLLALINDILDLSKVEAGKIILEQEDVAIDQICRASLHMVAQAALARRITLTSTLDSAVQHVRADARRLKQILVNLLSNAVKFTPNGGEVGLEVRGDAGQQQVTFTIWDTGIGIAKADMPKLFQSFMQIDSTLSRQYDGTGLGLALVRRLTEAHGGGVSVESTPGQGSRFSVTLPWAPDQAAQPSAPPAEREPAHAGAAERRDPAAPAILLVEDRQSNIDVVHDLLTAHGYKLLVARDGSEGLALMRQAQPALVLMDIHLPGMSGLDAIQQIRADEQLRATPVVALTALSMPGDRERCLQAGADDYLAKPISVRILLATVARLLERA